MSCYFISKVKVRLINLMMPPLKNKSSGDNNSGNNQPKYSLTTITNVEDQSVDKLYCSKLYPSKVLQNLNTIRQNNKFCDVEIVAGGKVVKVSCL